MYANIMIHRFRTYKQVLKSHLIYITGQIAYTKEDAHETVLSRKMTLLIIGSIMVQPKGSEYHVVIYTTAILLNSYATRQA